MLLNKVFHNVDSVIYLHNNLIGQNNTVVLFSEIKLMSNLSFHTKQPFLLTTLNFVNLQTKQNNKTYFVMSPLSHKYCKLQCILTLVSRLHRLYDTFPKIILEKIQNTKNYVHFVITII